MRPTIKDVSRHAGVSIKTVSRVLNRERYVGLETRARVEAAVAALNYRPSLAARSLAGKRSFQIALVCDNPSPHYVYEMQSGIRDRCQADGIRMIAQPYDRGSERLLDAIEALIDTTQIDGLILTPPVTDRPEVLDMLAARALPFVRVSPGTRLADSASTFIDNRAAARTIVAHLVALGHRRIGLVTGLPEYATSQQRADGYADALTQAAIGFDPGLVARGSYDFASGAAAAERLLALPVPPSAIFASNDDMAAGVLATAHCFGVRLPEALSVAGFGDDALAGYVWPPLTTIRQPVRLLGWTAADLLLAPPGTPERREIDYALVVRGSTAPFDRTTALTRPGTAPPAAPARTLRSSPPG